MQQVEKYHSLKIITNIRVLPYISHVCSLSNYQGAKIKRAELPPLVISILIFYEANFVARKTRAQSNQSPPNFPSIFVFSVPNAIEISFFQFHPKSGVMGQSGKVKGSMDSPYEMEATENEESEDRDNGNG